MNVNSQDFGQNYKAIGVYGHTQVAAAGSDNSEKTSAVIDRDGFDSGDLVIAGISTLTAAETLKATVKIAESEDGTTFAADETLVTAATLATGATTAAAFAYKLKLSLVNRKRYYKLKLTLDLSAGATDTATWGASVNHGGADSFPVAQS